MNNHKPKSMNKRTKFRKWLKRWEIVANWISKVSTIAIPVVIAYFVWQQNEISLHNQSLSSDREYELKLVEIAWDTYLAGDSLSISKTLKLIETLEPKVATKLASIISQDTTQPDEIRQNALSIVDSKTISSLIGYKIELYYLENNEEIKNLTGNAKNRLKMQDIEDVILIEKQKEFFEPYKNIINYANEDDYQSAKALSIMINSLNISYTFDLIQNKNIESNTLSIYICRKSNRKIGKPGTGPSVVTMLAATPGIPKFINNSHNSITFNFDNNGNSKVAEYAILIVENGRELGYLKPDGIIGNSAPIWQKYSEWGTVTVKNLKPDTSYTFKIKARNEEKVETEFSETSQIMKTL